MNFKDKETINQFLDTLNDVYASYKESDKNEEEYFKLIKISTLISKRVLMYFYKKFPNQVQKYESYTSTFFPYLKDLKGLANIKASCIEQLSKFQQNLLLLVYIRTKNTISKTLLVFSNINYILYLISKKINHFYDIDNEYLMDYLDEGIIGFLEGLENINENKINTFLPYVTFYIEFKLNNVLKEKTSSLQIPYSTFISFLKVKIYQEKYYSENNEFPSIETIKKAFPDVNDDMLNTILNTELKMLSLDSSLSNDDKIRFLDAIQDEQEDIKDNINKKYYEQIILNSLEQLKEKELKVVLNEYFLDEKVSYDKLAKELNVSENYIYKIKEKALEKIKQNILNNEKK